MNNQQFKTGLQSEMNNIPELTHNIIEQVFEIDVNTTIRFETAIDHITREWLQNRFTHGITVPEYDPRMVFINTPKQNNKCGAPAPATYLSAMGHFRAELMPLMDFTFKVIRIDTNERIGMINGMYGSFVNPINESHQFIPNELRELAGLVQTIKNEYVPEPTREQLQ